MTDSKAAWMPDWQSMQKQFFSAWTDATRGNALPQMPIQQGFDLWMKSLGARDSGNEVLDKVVGGAKQFTDFMQGVIGQLATTPAEMATPASMREALEKAFGGLAPQNNPALDALRGISSEGAKGFEEMFREWLKQVKPLETDARSALSMPAFGMNRESQERKQAMMQAFADYQDQNNRYNTLMFKASRLGLDKFESKLAERSEPGREITSMRGLYDVFVDAAEEGYAEVALSAEFREVYGALVNSQMRVRQSVQDEVERSTASLGMPGRGELDTVHQRMHDLRKRVAELEEKLNQMNELATAAAGANPAGDAVAPQATATDEPPEPQLSEPKPAARAKRAKAAPKATNAVQPKSSSRRSRS